MKGDAKPTLEEVAAMLCEGDTVPDWVTQKLHRNALLVGYHTKGTDDRSIERLLLESAFHLEDLLQLYPRAAKMGGEEYPPCIDDVTTPLVDLIEFLSKEVALPKRKGGPIPDDRRKLCARVCAELWEKLHGANQPRSEKLWEACEAYWQACGHPETSAHERLRNWERYPPKSVYPFVFVKYSENLSGVSGAGGASSVRNRMKVKNEGEASFLCIF